ncbi:hypothetical protein ABEB36_009805 [Hypothenemus hampei]|uniref:Transmembrane protein 186 n=1 Tax=Hypothenemus hampei TaxID=57062 RepID=A0ABD1EI21_HYPHA
MVFRCKQCWFYKKEIIRQNVRTLSFSNSLFNSSTGDEKVRNIKNTVLDIIEPQHGVHEIPKDYKTIYKFPLIKYFGLVNRLKVYHTVATVASSIGSTTLLSFELITTDFYITLNGIGLAGCLMFYSLGFAANKFIGFIYYNEKSEMIRVAYVDFWGRRQDVEIPSKDVVPRSEVSEMLLISKPWHSFKTYSGSHKLKLQLEKGIILDSNALNKIL